MENFASQTKLNCVHKSPTCGISFKKSVRAGERSTVSFRRLLGFLDVENKYSTQNKIDSCDKKEYDVT